MGQDEKRRHQGGSELLDGRLWQKPLEHRRLAIKSSDTENRVVVTVATAKTCSNKSVVKDREKMAFSDSIDTSQDWVGEQGIKCC